MKYNWLLIVLLCLLACSTQAWDGKRKGFNLGIGAGGYSLVTRPDNQTDISFHLNIGYALSERHYLLFDRWSADVGTQTIRDSTHFFQNYTYVGLAWYYYLSNASKSCFVGGGIGRYR